MENDSDENNFSKIKMNIKKLGVIWVLSRKLIKELNYLNGKKNLSTDFFCPSTFLSMCPGGIPESMYTGT